MFGSFNIGTDYTFTQSESQNNAVNKFKALSSYSGDSVVSEKSDSKVEAKKVAPKSSDSKNVDTHVFADKTKNDSSVPEIKLLGQGTGEDDNSDYLYNSDGQAVSITNSFDALAAVVGGVGGKVTKDQLVTYLHSLTANPTVSADHVEEVTFIKGLIAQFDTLSDKTGYITSFNGIKEPQDYTTVTKEQVTPPVDIRV